MVDSEAVRVGDLILQLKFAVLGAGNGGQAFAAELWAKGFETNLFELPKFEQAILPIRENHGVKVTSMTEASKAGKGTHFVKMQGKVTSDIEEAINGVDVIMIVVPAFAHLTFARHCAKHLSDGQIIVLNPGSTGGALEFYKALKDLKNTKRILVAETTSLLFACRTMGPAWIQINSVKKQMPIAALPALDTVNVVKSLKQAFSEFVPAKNVLETSINRPGMIFHPVSTILNVVKIEQMGSYNCNGYDATPSVARAMEAADDERLGVAKALGLEEVSVKEWLQRFYGVKAENLYEALQSCPAYKQLPTSPNLQFRFITEDVPYMMVPVSSFGDLLGVRTPTINAFIQISSVINRTDYSREGRTVEKLGLASMKADEIMKYVTEGADAQE